MSFGLRNQPFIFTTKRLTIKQDKGYNVISRGGGRLGRKQARCNFLSKTNKTKYFQIFVDKQK